MSKTISRNGRNGMISAPVIAAAGDTLGSPEETGKLGSGRRASRDKRPAARRNRRGRRPSARKGEGIAAIAFLGVSLAGISVFFLIPFVETIRRSFYDARGKNYIGLDGYESVLANSAFRLAAANTAKFAVICIPLLLAASLITALLIRAVRPRGRAFKTTYLLPMAVPVASVVLLWQVVFRQNGLANTVLAALGAEPIDFMGSSAAFWVLIFTYLWKNNGYDMILWLAGLDGINDNLYEAARVDGASSWRCFRYITLPGLLPTVGLVSILSLLNGFKVFREAYLVAGSYPHESIYLLQHLFNNWFRDLDVSRLCAAAVMLSVVLLVIILALQRLFREAE